VTLILCFQHGALKVSERWRRGQPTRRSPFADVNGFQYHGNWLHNFLIAASLGGHKL
jgi:hypothetical protein